METGQSEAATAPPAAAPRRLLSLDALRGANMLWIIGLDEVLRKFADRHHNPIVTAVCDNLASHTEWRGFHFYDMIFPLFLFIIGVALPFATEKRLRQGAAKAQIVAKVLRRTATLFVLGWIYSGLLKFEGFDHLRIMGVLQRLALGYCGAALIMLFTRPRAQVVIVAAILLSYWAAMALIHVPGVPRGTFTEVGNLAYYVDRCVFKPGQLYPPRHGDPEGLLSTIPAVATALLGVLVGQWLKSGREETRKVLGLAMTGIALIAVGYLWGCWFPVIKKIWTSSYVLVAGGWSMLFLALFYWVIDIRGYKRWSYFFVVIGVNPLTIYVGEKIVKFKDIAGFFVNGALRFVPFWKPFLLAVSILFVKWLFLRFLDEQKIYLRA